VQLIRSEDLPAANRTASRAVVRILWPLQPSIIDPKQFPTSPPALCACSLLPALKSRRSGHGSGHCEEPGDGRCGLVEVPAAAEPHPMSYVAESSLAAAERLQHIKRHCQQKDARIYAERGWNAVLAVESIDAMTEPAPRRAQTEVPPRGALPQALPRRGGVVA
jgi:hypothetical protein